MAGASRYPELPAVPAKITRPAASSASSTSRRERAAAIVSGSTSHSWQVKLKSLWFRWTRDSGNASSMNVGSRSLL